MSDQSSNNQLNYPTLLGVGCFLFVLALVVWFDAAKVMSNQTVGVGPTAGMKIIAGLLVILAISHFVAAWRQYLVREESPQLNIATHFKKSILFLLGGLVGMIILLELGIGFIVSSAFLFTFTARAFGQSLGPKSISIGLILSTLVFWFFNRVLSLTLPIGFIEKFFLG